jgi:hypothetical protein
MGYEAFNCYYFDQEDKIPQRRMTCQSCREDGGEKFIVIRSYFSVQQNSERIHALT